MSTGANVTHDVVYQDEEGQWVTDLAYYSSFQKDADKRSEDTAQLQSEEFAPPGAYPQNTVILKDLIIVVFLVYHCIFLI